MFGTDIDSSLSLHLPLPRDGMGNGVRTDLALESHDHPWTGVVGIACVEGVHLEVALNLRLCAM